MVLHFDELLEHLNFGGLGVPIVHNLVKELVNHNKVVLDRLGLQVLEVVNQDLFDVVQEGEGHHGVYILCSDRKEGDVGVLGEDEAETPVHEEGLH